ncbi:MAG: hypothetical protein LBH85_02355 [Treponema sp.]|nr:hypothetical protein [Treponema sp.]
MRKIYESRIKEWALRLKQENIGTKSRLITVLRIIFGYALKARDVDDNPMDRVELLP